MAKLDSLPTEIILYVAQCEFESVSLFFLGTFNLHEGRC
jgi:hypothetical protein